MLTEQLQSCDPFATKKKRQGEEAPGMATQSGQHAAGIRQGLEARRQIMEAMNFDPVQRLAVLTTCRMRCQHVYLVIVREPPCELVHEWRQGVLRVTRICRGEDQDLVTLHKRSPPLSIAAVEQGGDLFGNQTDQENEY